jgi:hypothetical protein
MPSGFGSVFSPKSSPVRAHFAPNGARTRGGERLASSLPPGANRTGNAAPRKGGQRPPRSRLAGRPQPSTSPHPIHLPDAPRTRSPTTPPDKPANDHLPSRSGGHRTSPQLSGSLSHCPCEKPDPRARARVSGPAPIRAVQIEPVPSEHRHPPPRGATRPYSRKAAALATTWSAPT